MTPEQEEHLMTTVTKVGTKMDALISDDHSSGLVPEVQAKVQTHDQQINFWRGAIYVIAGILTAVVSALAAHIFGGK